MFTQSVYDGTAVVPFYSYGILWLDLSNGNFAYTAYTESLVKEKNVHK